MSSRSMSLFRRAEFQFWRCAEPRAVFEWQSFYLLKPLLRRLPKGDGHPVIVFPGFASSDRATQPVRSVISLGSPISANSKHSNADALFRILNGQKTEVEAARGRSLREAPPVPTSSIYSKTDGIVAWEGSIQENSSQAENIEVPASHLGIGVNPLVIMVLADRLAQSESNWQRYKRKGVGRWFFRIP